MSKLINYGQAYIPYYKRNLRLAFPVMLTQAGAALVGFLDSVMVGHYSTNAIAAVSIANAIFFSIITLSMGIIMGITPLINILSGQKDAESQYSHQQYVIDVASILNNGILVTITSILITITLLIICFLTIDKMGQDPDVIHNAKPYFLLIIISSIPFLIFCLFKQFIEGLNNTSVAMVITLTVNALNLLLNYIFIFGHWGFPPMGATGAGYATLISRTLMPLFFFIAIYTHKKWRIFFHMLNIKQFSCKRIIEIFRVGTPIGLQIFLETILFTLSLIIVGWINKESAVAHQIATHIADMTFMLAVGVGSATTIRVAYQYGQKNVTGLKMAANASIHLVLLFNSFGALLMITLRNVLPLLFTTDLKVIPIASQLILCAGFFQYADGMQAIGIAILRGLTDVKKPMIYAFFSYILVAFPIGLLVTFTFNLGAIGMWIGFIVGLSLAAFLFHYRFRHSPFLNSDVKP